MVTSTSKWAGKTREGESLATVLGKDEEEKYEGDQLSNIDRSIGR